MTYIQIHLYNPLLYFWIIAPLTRRGQELPTTFSFSKKDTKQQSPASFDSLLFIIKSHLRNQLGKTIWLIQRFPISAASNWIWVTPSSFAPFTKRSSTSRSSPNYNNSVESTYSSHSLFFQNDWNRLASNHN